MKLSDWLRNARVVAVVDNQFGDTGKGKFVDLLAERSDVIARGTGGANAGHTVCCNGRRFSFHLLPSGILCDADGKVNIIGNGVAVDPRVVCHELDTLADMGMSTNGLRVAYNAKLVLPQHLLLDRIRERAMAGGQLGTTGRGIGPAYRDHYDRLGLTVNDLLNVDVFVCKLRRNLEEKVSILRHVDSDLVRHILSHDHLGSGRFYHSTHVIDEDAIVQEYRRFGLRLAHYVTDTDALIRQAVYDDKRVLLEGAQGILLSIDHGTYPYVTSSDCSIHGLARGVGLPQRVVDRTLGITKAFYMTRVGEGPFPTELGRERSAAWCRDATATREAETAQQPDINDADELRQGMAIRQRGDEYGTTTMRPRRTGWLDVPFLRYAMNIHGCDMALTMIDVLDDCDVIKVCTKYFYQGPDYYIGDRLLQAGTILTTAYPDVNVLTHCQPHYKHLPGWNTLTRDIRKREHLPLNLQNLIAALIQWTSANIVAISVGPDREQTILQ